MLNKSGHSEIDLGVFSGQPQVLANIHFQKQNYEVLTY